MYFAALLYTAVGQEQLLESDTHPNACVLTLPHGYGFMAGNYECSVRVSLLPCGPGYQPSCKSHLIWYNSKNDWGTSSQEPAWGHACFRVLGWHLFCPLVWQSSCFHVAVGMSWSYIRCWKIIFLRFAFCCIHEVKNQAQLSVIPLSDYTHLGCFPGQCSHVETSFHLL